MKKEKGHAVPSLRPKKRESRRDAGATESGSGERKFTGADAQPAPVFWDVIENGNYFLAWAKFSSTCAQLMVFHQASR